MRAETCRVAVAVDARLLALGAGSRLDTIDDGERLRRVRVQVLSSTHGSHCQTRHGERGLWTRDLRAALEDIAGTFGAAVLTKEIDTLGCVLALISIDHQLTQQRRQARRGVYRLSILHDLAVSPGNEFEVDYVGHLQTKVRFPSQRMSAVKFGWDLPRRHAEPCSHTDL